MKEQYNIFYSWQSDLPKESNLNGIRQALRDAAGLIENKLVDTRLELDEATRDTTGSPNIPLTIFSKIEKCDVFVCDLTTIDNSIKSRKTPNPNVLIELGFAIATVGWERIIMLFNTNFGTFPQDLPFDIDRHRATSFSIKDKSDKNGKNQLSQIIYQSVLSILEKSPLKPDQLKAESHEQKKRRVDVSNLKWILNSIHIPTFDHFFEDFPTLIVARILFYKEGYFSTFESNSFHLYDQKLFRLLKNLKDNWEKSLSYYKHYSPDGGGQAYKFYIPNDIFVDESAERDFKELLRIRLILIKNFKDLLKYIRTEYLEIDLDEASRLAHDYYRNFVE